MEHTKVSHPQGQLPPRPRSVVKHETTEGGEGEGGGGEFHKQLTYVLGTTVNNESTWLSIKTSEEVRSEELMV